MGLKTHLMEKPIHPEKNCTGTRIRTQIKGFGDLYTNRCTMPVYDPAAGAGTKKELLIKTKYSGNCLSTLQIYEKLLKKPFPGHGSLTLLFL
jgi:hypothetical protein